MSKLVYIRSRRPHHPALRVVVDSNSIGWSGRVRADQFENATGYECWTLKHLGNDMYHIIFSGAYSRGSYQRLYLYLQASPDGDVCCKSYDGDGCGWKIESTRKGYVSIKSFYGKYLCCDDDFRVTANREHCELWEQWAIVHMHHLLITPTREVYIRSFQHHLFCKNEGLPAFVPSIAKANCYGPAKNNDVWQVRCIGDNKILLKSDFGRLSSDEDGTVKLIKHTTFPESKGMCWIIENVEGGSKNTVALKSEYGRYLCRDNGDHFMADDSVKADSSCCRDKSTWWVFLTDSDDVYGNTALEKDAITMKDHNIEYS